MHVTLFVACRGSFLPNNFLLQHSCCNCGMKKSPQGPSGWGPGQWVWLVPVPVWVTGRYLQVLHPRMLLECWDLQQGLPGAVRGSTATATPVPANHSRGLAWSQLPWLLDIPLLSAAFWPRGETGMGLAAAFHPRASGQGSGFLGFDRKAAQMKPLSAPSGGFTLPQVLIFSRCFT